MRKIKKLSIQGCANPRGLVGPNSLEIPKERRGSIRATSHGRGR